MSLKKTYVASENIQKISRDVEEVQEFGTLPLQKNIVTTRELTNNCN